MSILNYLPEKTGGINIEGIIEEYYVYAGETISAGDFVEFINGVAGETEGTSADTQLSTTTYTGYTISAAKLDDNRVFIAHSYGTNYHLYAMIVNIGGGNITYGEDILLCDNTYAATRNKISTVALDENRVLVLHNYNPSSDYLYGIVCTISDTTITKGNVNSIVSANYGLGSVSACLLSTNKVFIAYSYNDDYYYLNSIVCTISGETITAGNAKELSSTDYSGQAISTCLLPNGNVFIAHSYGQLYYLYGMVCTISDTTITKGTDISISTSGRAGRWISTCLLANGNVFIAHSMDDSFYLYGIVVTINGTGISKGNDTKLSDVALSGRELATELLDNGNVLIIHSHTSSKFYLYGMILTIDGTTITAGSDTELNNNYAGLEIEIFLSSNGNVFVAHSNTATDYYLNAQIFGIDYDNNIPTNHIVFTEYETQVTAAIEPPFDGIALSNGVGAPEFIEGEVKKTGNIFPTTGWNADILYTKYSTADGYVLEASHTLSSSYPVYRMCDSDTSTNWISGNEDSCWFQMTMPKATKITKMNILVNRYIQVGSTQYFENFVIQGSKDGNNWVDLYTSTNYGAGQQNAVELTLNNTDFYLYYKISVVSGDTNKQINVYDWQTSEYIVKEQVPSTEHNEQVKIVIPAGLITSDGLYFADKDGKLIIPKGDN